MEEVVPCSSIAVDSALRIGTAGAIWGLCISPHDAREKGLTGAAKASFVAKSVGRCSFQCGLIAGVFQMSHCWIEQYRGRKDWKNSVIAGAVGAAAATAVTGIRKWDVMVALACVLSGINAAVEFSRTK
ncbi:hypothetical protein SLEP1_g32046 [Rubroshorea leprosula]|uniref:Outer envelope pore protein 16-4, chloroplastic n=1 Tax=Rubroshorea leprosula TaxID=152421 RepID=A0AAV5KC93_9ROSI|nr:hypothetical protein SLEP1_g32046 [Rubroshorea leprosula]